MALDVSTLLGYVDQLSGSILRAAVAEQTTFKYINIVEGVKGSQALKILKSNLTGTQGACTTINPQDSSSLTERMISVKDISVSDFICIKDIELTYLGMSAKKGSYNETVPNELEAAFLAEKTDEIGKLMEFLFWQGDTTGSGNTALVDGMIKLLRNTAGVVTVGQTSGVGVDLAENTAFATIKSILAARPTDMRNTKNQYMFMSNANYDTLVYALVGNNNFGYANAVLEAGQDRTFVLPASNVTAVATSGLDGKHEIVEGEGRNFVMGTDDLNDANNFDMWYEKKDRKLYWYAEWKQGVQVAFPNQAVLYTGVPA